MSIANDVTRVLPRLNYINFVTFKSLGIPTNDFFVIMLVIFSACIKQHACSQAKSS